MENLPKQNTLKHVLANMGSALLACSGGTDSMLLLDVAHEVERGIDIVVFAQFLEHMMDTYGAGQEHSDVWMVLFEGSQGIQDFHGSFGAIVF